MPFQSEAQRKYLYAKKPDVAEKFAEHEKPKEQGTQVGNGAMDMKRRSVAIETLSKMENKKS